MVDVSKLPEDELETKVSVDTHLGVVGDGRMATTGYRAGTPGYASAHPEENCLSRALLRRLSWTYESKCGFRPFPDPPAEEPPIPATTFN